MDDAHGTSTIPPVRIREPGGNRLALSRTIMKRARSGNAAALLRTSGGVDRRAEVAHVAREHAVELGSSDTAAALDGQIRLLGLADLIAHLAIEAIPQRRRRAAAAS